MREQIYHYASGDAKLVENEGKFFTTAVGSSVFRVSGFTTYVNGVYNKNDDSVTINGVRFRSLASGDKASYYGKELYPNNSLW